uniref:synemin n=1 Tax=Pristiophorus japonicus TaxID=55135 RepID=UPI00398ED407
MQSGIMFPFRSSILREKSQLQELNSRLESYLGRVRQLEQENQLLATEVQHLRSEGRTEEKNAYVEEINRMRWEVEELAFEKGKAEMQRRRLWQEIQQLQRHQTTEEKLCKGISQELAEQESTLEQAETSNASLEEYISQLQRECLTLEAEHERAQGDLREKVRRAPNLLLTQGSHMAPLTEEDVGRHALVFSEMWQGNFDIYKGKIEELEAAVQLDNERGEELDQERVLLIREIEALKKELLEQFNFQKQLEEDFLIFLQKRAMDVEEYQRAIDLLEDEKQHLMSSITLNLTEQQQLMQVKMGLSLELATYRALLEAELAKQQGIEEHLRKPRQGTDTRSQTYSVVVRPMLSPLGGKKWKTINIPSSFRRDREMITTGPTPKPGPSRISTRKIINGSFSDGDLLYTDKSLSVIQSVAPSARSINASRFTPASSDPYRTTEKASVQHKVFPEKVDEKSRVGLRGDERGVDVATHRSKITVEESVNDNKADVSQNEENKTNSQRSNELPQSLSEVQDYNYNGRSTEPAEEEYERRSSKDVITVKPAPNEVEFKVEFSNGGPSTPPDRYIHTTQHEVGAEITDFQSDNITEKDREEPRMEAVEMWTETSTEEPNDNQGIVISEEGTLINNIRNGDIIETVVKPTDLKRVKVSPDSVITYHTEEVLGDGTTKREITIQSRREETVDVTDECALEEMLNIDAESPELQLKGALEHVTGSKTESFVGGLLSLGSEGAEGPGRVSVNVGRSEQTSEPSAEAGDLSMPADTALFGSEDNDHEGKGGTYQEVVNITMTDADFRKTMLADAEPALQAFMESSSSFAPSNAKADDLVSEEAELLGTHGPGVKLQQPAGEGGEEEVEHTVASRHDSLSKVLSAPCLIEESIQVSHGVQASIVELLNEETDDPKVKLKGALEQLKGVVPESLRDELSLLTRDDQEGSDVSINIKNVQQSSHGGVVTIEAEVNVSQSLDPEDFYSMEEYNEGEGNTDELGPGLKFLNTQQKIQELLSGKGLKMVDTLHGDGGGIQVKVGDVREQLVAVPESSARDVEDPDEYTRSQGGLAVHGVTESSEMEGDLPDESAWFQQAPGKMYGEELIQTVSDPADSSVTLRMNVNRIVSMHTTGGDNEGGTFITQQEQVAEGIDERRRDDDYWYEEWGSGSRGVTEEGEEQDLQSSDSELMQYSASPNGLTKRRMLASEVVHGEQELAVTYLDDEQADNFLQSDDEL